eukprot:366445-Chlamydomonas_euryale.AAC.14
MPVERLRLRATGRVWGGEGVWEGSREATFAGSTAAAHWSWRPRVGSASMPTTSIASQCPIKITFHARLHTLRSCADCKPVRVDEDHLPATEQGRGPGAAADAGHPQVPPGHDWLVQPQRAGRAHALLVCQQHSLDDAAAVPQVDDPGARRVWKRLRGVRGSRKHVSEEVEFFAAWLGTPVTAAALPEETT